MFYFDVFRCRAAQWLVAAVLVSLFISSWTKVSAQESTLRLAAPISDHMVLQHGSKTSVWGMAQPNANVSIQFAGKTTKTEADKDGQWSAKLGPFNVSATPSKMKISSNDASIEVSDILVGEVWMCSGQSNMAFRLSATENPKYEEADLPNVRFFKTDSATALKPQSDCGGKWMRMTPDSAKGFSAVGYYFGKKLNEELGVPIGLIDTSWGGKPVEAFTSLEKLKTTGAALPLIDEWNSLDKRYDAEKAKSRYDKAMTVWKEKVTSLRAKMKQTGEKVKLPRRPQLQVQPKLDPNYPAAIYNQKVAPWHKYSIAGAIWYQGEANRNRAVQYQSLLTALIEDWRQRWGQPFPFYIVQLASFQAATTEPGIADSWAELQHAQTLVAQNVPKCGIAIANDIGAANDIHPKNKRDVGDRLALLALGQHYGKSLKAFASPLYKGHKIKANHVLVEFDDVGDGLKSRDGGPLKRFEIAGKDQKWFWAKAEIVGTNQVDLTADDVPEPVAARYAWASNPTDANLVNSAGLPASLFRTDNWSLSTQNNFTRRNPADTAKLLTRQGFKPLFNGKNLNGWRNPYKYGQAEVVGDEIHLTANKKFFLVTKNEYSDFELVVDIKLPEGKANSGVMLRCHVEPNKVFGYQAECDGSDRRWSGGLYDEGRRKWIWPSTQGRSEKKFLEYEEESKAHFAKPEVRDALKRNDWNRYEIKCQGDQIVIRVNGVETTNLRDDVDASGFIAIQHHGEKGQTYRFRNLYIKELK
ncbi:MAG: family 16 glycoside hydrolase [Planctomycetota bacterium]